MLTKNRFPFSCFQFPVKAEKMFSEGGRGKSDGKCMMFHLSARTQTEQQKEAHEIIVLI